MVADFRNRYKEGESTDENEILDRPLKRSRDEKSYANEEDLILSRVLNYINPISDTSTLEKVTSITCTYY
jgi:hypothetical protein